MSTTCIDIDGVHGDCECRTCTTEPPLPVSVLVDEPVDGRALSIQEMPGGFYILRTEDDGTLTTVATAQDPMTAVFYVRSLLGLGE